MVEDPTAVVWSEMVHSPVAVRVAYRYAGRIEPGFQANRAALDFVQFAKHCIRLTRELK